MTNPPSPQGPDMSPGERIMILLVDDRPENLLAYQAILGGELDLELVCARSGGEALKEVLVHDFAVILLDVNMPGIDGFETASLIRQRKRSAHTPIIFVTAFPDEVRAAQGYAHGAVDYLQSPIVPPVLRAKVRVFVELFRLNLQIMRQSEERFALARERVQRAAVEEANSRLTFLAEATAVIGRSLDDRVTACDVARLTVPKLGDLAIVARADPAGNVWHIVRASVDGEATTMEEFSNLERLPPHVAEAVRRSLAAGVVVRLPEGSAPSTPPPHSSAVEPQVVVLPLCVQKSTRAVLAISREPSGRRLTAADLTVAEGLASRAAIALENAQLYKDLEHADLQKNEFLSMLAHELRNPLAPIRTAVDVLRLQSDDQTEIVWARDIIDRQTTHLVRLVDDLLDVSRITGGKIRLEMECVDVASVVSTATETSRPLIRDAGHQLTVSLPEEPLYVNCDPVRLSQVLSNLLNNAAKYTRPGGSIRISVERDGPEAVFRVRDDGIGIPREMLAKVFDLFTQIEGSLDRSRGGLGVGLTLAKRLIEMHGGRIEAASEGSGQGSEFTIRLAAASPAASPESSTGAAPAPCPAADLAPEATLRVLVVDDNVDAADGIAWLLRRKNHRVSTAHDGRSAVDLAAEFLPQVVVLDLGLPKLDGYQVAHRLRGMEATRNALIIAVSGYGQDEDRRRSSEAGVDYHFVKPVNFEALLRVLHSTGGTPSQARAPLHELEQIES